MSVDADEVDVVSGILWGAGVLGIEERALDGGRVQLRAGLDVGAESAGVAAAVGSRWTVEVEVVEDDSWLDAWQAHAAPVEVGARLLVVPTWLSHRAEAPAGGARLVVHLPPHRTFGSGAHPTTRLALEELEQLVHPGTTVLDVGCGSGLLAVAAARLGAAAVVAVDIDPEAVRATAATVARNGVSTVVAVSSTPLAALEGRFEVVVANIVLPVLEELLPAMAARMGIDAVLVLTGILVEQLDRLIDACAAAGLTAAPGAVIEGWALVRATARPRPSASGQPTGSREM